MYLYGIGQAHNSIHSVIPLLFACSGDAQSAVDQAIGFLEESVLEFEETIRRLQEDPIASDAVSKRQLHSFIKGCEFYCSGNLAWR